MKHNLGPPLLLTLSHHIITTHSLPILFSAYAPRHKYKYSIDSIDTTQSSHNFLPNELSEGAQHLDSLVVFCADRFKFIYVLCGNQFALNYCSQRFFVVKMKTLVSENQHPTFFINCFSRRAVNLTVVVFIKK